MTGILKKLIDIFAICSGLIALVFTVTASDGEGWAGTAGNIFCMISGILGACYLLYAVILFFFMRIEFDWKLIHGNFLRKVICLVVLLPFTLTYCIMPVVSDPKELAYDGLIYSPEDEELGGDIRQRQKSPGLFWAVYLHFVDPGNQTMSTTASGRAAAGAAAILGIFLLNGLLVSSIIGFIDKRKDWRMNGEIRYRAGDFGRNRFAIVIGANETAAAVIRNLLSPRKKNDLNFKCEGYNRYILLQTCQEPETVRNRLSSHLTDSELRKVIIYKAFRDSKAEIGKLFPDHATEIYVLGESTARESKEPSHDTLNMRCVSLLADTLKCGKRKVCKVLLDYQTTYSVFQFANIPENVNSKLDFIPFNRYDSWAREVLVECRAVSDCSDGRTVHYIPLDGHGIGSDSDRYVHFIIVGMSQMGMALGIEALHQAHYLNAGKRKSRITFIDAEADTEMDFFRGRYQNLLSLARHRYLDTGICTWMSTGWTDPMEEPGCRWKHLDEDGKNFMDVEIEFIKGRIESDRVREYLSAASKDNDSIMTVAVCFNQAHQALAASLYLPVEVYSKAQQILVYQNENEDIVRSLNETVQKDRRYKMIRPFGMEYGSYLCDRTQYLKALLANGIYDDGDKKIDISDAESYAELQKSWNKLPMDKKFSNSNFIDSIYTKLRGICPDAEEYITDISSLLRALGDDALERKLPELIEKYSQELAMTEHNRWNVQQLLFGYMPCNPEQDRMFAGLNADRNKAAASGDKDAKKAAKARFRKIKDEYKESENRIHANICSYGHLDQVDSGAKPYDTSLNEAIPRFLREVDMKTITDIKKECNERNQTALWKYWKRV